MAAVGALAFRAASVDMEVSNAKVRFPFSENSALCQNFKITSEITLALGEYIPFPKDFNRVRIYGIY